MNIYSVQLEFNFAYVKSCLPLAQVVRREATRRRMRQIMAELNIRGQTVGRSLD